MMNSPDHTVAARSSGTLGAAALLALVTTGSVNAQLAIESYWLSSDVDAMVREAGGPSRTVFDDRSVVYVDENGEGSAFAITGLLDLDGADLDALDNFPRRYSIDVRRNIGGVEVEPGDTFYILSGAAVIDFDASAAGIPANVNLDALTTNPETGFKVLSFDRWFNVPNLGFVTPGDLVEFDGTNFTLYFDGQLLPDGLNVDAAHILDTGQLLVSFDTDAELPGGPGTFFLRDDDVVLIDRDVFNTLPLLSMQVAHPSWVAADIDALWVERAVNAGSIRFNTAFREVQESVGTLSFQVERIDGGETAIQARVTSINGSAQAGSDFVAVDTVLSWGDGETGARNFSVTILDDAFEESLRERFEIQLAIESGEPTLDSPTRIQITILDDDGDNLFADSFES